MKKLIKFSGPILFLFSALMLSLNVYASFHDSAEVTNHFSLGDVNIGIKEYELIDENEVEYQDQKQVMPGDVISKIPRITNYAEPCYIRARVLVHDLNTGIAFPEENIQFDSAWIKRGSFYYYPSALKKDVSVDLFHQIEIPSNWGKSMEERTFHVEVIAQAIQAAHFQPALESSEPWGKQTILQCIHEQDGKVITEKDKAALNIKLDGEAGKIMIFPDDFFSNFGYLMPGDTLKDSVKITNFTDEKLQLWFRTDHSEASQEQYDLMRQMRMKIYRDDLKIYEGNVASDLLEKEICLYVLEPREQGILSFEIEVPTSIDNTYALADGLVRWHFRAESAGTEKITTPPHRKGGTRTSGKKITNRKNVKTGDNTKLNLWIIMMTVSLILTILSINGKRGDAYEKEEE
ncbi:MAG: hypothetical protein Q4B47_01345 [Eubacteriales bacterium]|nr:hypothetical protein [Eubacteriales bacterium]